MTTMQDRPDVTEVSGPGPRSLLMLPELWGAIALATATASVAKRAFGRTAGSTR